MAEDLRWHFKPGAQVGTTVVIGARRRGRLDGYLALMRTETPNIDLVRARIADLLVAADDAHVVDALLAEAYRWGAERGCHLLELIGLPAAIRRGAEKSRPFSRPLPTQPFVYKALNADVQAALRSEAAWYPSMYDGDTSLV
jgi:hypothetical protein